MIFKAKKGQSSYGEAIGIILMDGFYPFPPGTPGNATTFSYPVRYKLVKGATRDRILYQRDQTLTKLFIEAGWDLVKEGVRAVAGNCGYMILFQEQMAKELPVPVFMSSFLQLPFISRLLSAEDKIGLITTEKRVLQEQHLQIAGVENTSQISVAGMEDQAHFHEAIHSQKGELDFDKIEADLVQVAVNLVESDKKIKALLFECTDMPPYAAAVQAAVGLPIFDCITGINYVFSTLVRNRYEGFM